MGVRPAELTRVGFRRSGSSSGGGLPFGTPLVPGAVVWINDAGTTAETSTQLLYKDAGTGSKTFAVLGAGSALAVTDNAHLVVKGTSGRTMAIFRNAGGTSIILDGGGSVDNLESRAAGGFRIGGNVAGGFNNTGMVLNAGNPGNAAWDLTTDQATTSLGTSAQCRFLVRVGGLEGFRVGSGPSLGFFGVGPSAQHASSTSGPAGAVYGVTEQAMLNDVFSAMKAYGLLS